jgi:Surface adhesin CshA repetitive domain
VFKKFILGSLLVAGLTACPVVEPIIDPLPKSPIAKDDNAETLVSQSTTIKPYANDQKGDAELVRASIDLNSSVDGQQLSYKDSTGKGTFTLNTSTGDVTFSPSATAKVGEFARALYTIKDSNGSISSPATIKVTISSTVPTGPIKVLFIGNSRTRYESCVSGFPTYNIPKMLQDISNASAETRKIDATVVTDCGKYLKQHYDDGNFAGRARGFLALGGWEYVVLQAHTNEVDATLRSTVQLFQTEIQRTNPNAKIILYENWRKLGISQQTDLTLIFEGVASSLGIKLAPVGRSWVRSSLADNQLFNGDGELIHATALGAYTAASTFYWMIYKKDVPAVGVPSGLFGLDAAARTGAKNAYAEMTSNFK